MPRTRHEITRLDVVRWVKINLAVCFFASSIAWCVALVVRILSGVKLFESYVAMAVFWIVLMPALSAVGALVQAVLFNMAVKMVGGPIVEGRELQSENDESESADFGRLEGFGEPPLPWEHQEASVS